LGLPKGIYLCNITVAGEQNTYSKVVRIVYVK
jgi:hypothetical protein